MCSYAVDRGMLRPRGARRLWLSEAIRVPIRHRPAITARSVRAVPGMKVWWGWLGTHERLAPMPDAAAALRAAFAAASGEPICAAAGDMSAAVFIAEET